MGTEDKDRNDSSQPVHAIELGELAGRIRWRRYILSRAASNPYLESPSYAA